MRRRRPQRYEGGTVDWPGLTGPSPYTFEGAMIQRQALIDNLLQAPAGPKRTFALVALGAPFLIGGAGAIVLGIVAAVRAIF